MVGLPVELDEGAAEVLAHRRHHLSHPVQVICPEDVVPVLGHKDQVSME